ncbi:MAG TPA: BadF/BadG/BcrA/BcrD ATPase family protein, partial [Candidatus Acidoferrales bacterium]|nr:BadF/BadG/BcrA/BcrD ATPase family protein [Candidatus Acidoferrales bacterium]
ARRSAGLGDDAVFEAVVCGLTGYEEGEPQPTLQTRARRLRVLHDSEIALTAALDGGAGIVVIGGTGSVALGRDEGGTRVRVGGWGFLFGDEGSAFWIARRAATQAMHRVDRGEDSTLARALLAHTALPSLRAVQQAFAHGELSRSALASFAPVLLQHARAGDVEAHLIRSEAARALAELAARAHARLSRVPQRRISYTGGLFADEPLRATWREAVAERIAGAVVVEPRAEAALGALRLAREMVLA